MRRGRGDICRQGSRAVQDRDPSQLEEGNDESGPTLPPRGWWRACGGFRHRERETENAEEVSERMNKRIFVLVLIACVLIAGQAFAQLTPEGRIVGKVVDKQGNPLPGVNVGAASPKLIGKAAAVTDAAGVYRLMALPSGIYEITFTLQGFKTLIRKGIIL